MTDYTSYIEERLNALMNTMPIMEAAASDTDSEIYVKDAPKVKGYFKFISIRFAKRIRDIKKMCVEYINTYVESALNVAKNMDDVNITKEQDKDTLAKELNFGAIGASTNGEKKESDTKEGVLFLTGDKALLNKMNAIIEKIKLRAEKNKKLMEWASLMIAQSKIMANDIIRKETNKFIKNEKTRKERERKAEEKRKAEQAKFDQECKERMQRQKNGDATYTKFGSPDEVLKKVGFEKIKDIKDEFNGIDNSFFDKPLFDSDGKLDTNVEINKRRKTYYEKRHAEETVQQAIEFAKASTSESYNQHFMFASFMVNACDMKNDEESFPNPLDIIIATLNNKDIEINKDVKKPISGINENDFIDSRIDSTELFKTDEDKNTFTKGDYTTLCPFLYLTTLSEQNKVLENAGAILTTSQFIAEANLTNAIDNTFNNDKVRQENIEMIIDLLNDYEGGISLRFPYKAKDGDVSAIRMGDDGQPMFLSSIMHMGDLSKYKVELTNEELGELTYYLLTNY